MNKHVPSDTEDSTNFYLVSYSECPVISLRMLQKNAVSGLYWWVKKAKKKDIIREFDDQDANAKDNKTYPDKHITNQAVSSWATTRFDSWTTLEMFLLSNR